MKENKIDFITNHIEYIPSKWSFRLAVVTCAVFKVAIVSGALGAGNFFLALVNVVCFAIYLVLTLKYTKEMTAVRNRLVAEAVFTMEEALILTQSSAYMGVVACKFRLAPIVICYLVTVLIFCVTDFLLLKIKDNNVYRRCKARIGMAVMILWLLFFAWCIKSVLSSGATTETLVFCGFANLLLFSVVFTVDMLGKYLSLYFYVKDFEKSDIPSEVFTKGAPKRWL